MKRQIAGLMFGLMCGLGSGCSGTPDLTDSPGEARPVADGGPALPPEAATWATVGAFTLRDGGQDVEVRVYADDSDARGGYTYPNFLTMRAYYRTGSSLWKRAEAWKTVR